MREIKFRGLSYFTNQWVYGTGAHNGKGNKNYINTPGGMIQTHEGSNGQFTGLTDKNGKEIYEGDIIKLNDNNQTTVGEIKFYSGGWYIVEGRTVIDLYECVIDGYEIEVIGNVFENIELLEV